ncbi:MAG: amidinotransferase [Bacteroidetes bacterium]|jgi:N-dimethylarginine dimethylaminohydrolase|nr:amidinotransferase [Bacteroidota bacterium]MDF2451873.1 amidinotransferase [Bacteroidota bacterium]
MPVTLQVNNETSALDSVILGIGTDPGDPGSGNPKTEFHLDHGTYPSRASLLNNINDFERVLIENGIKVFRPINLQKKTQLFTRDLGFVIGDELFLCPMVEGRKKEIQGISYLLDHLGPVKTIDLSKEKGINIEGGDVILTDDTIFVGLSQRTNTKAYRYLKKRFAGKRNVIQIKIVADQNDYQEHSLHLDCVFNPLGKNCAIVYERGIKNVSKLYEHLQMQKSNIFKPNTWQFVAMCANVFSINPHTVIIEREFIDLNYWLKARGFTTIEVNFKEISKLGGLLRCSTLPLRREP